MPNISFIFVYTWYFYFQVNVLYNVRIDLVFFDFNRGYRYDWKLGFGFVNGYTLASTSDLHNIVKVDNFLFEYNQQYYIENILLHVLIQHEVVVNMSKNETLFYNV